MGDSYLAIQVVMMPRDTNPHGTIFGGLVHGAFVDPHVAARVLGCMVATLVVAVILQKSCSFVGVEVPEFLKAVGISAVTLFLSGLATLFISLIVRHSGWSERLSDVQSGLVISSIAIPINILIGAVLYVPFLKTRFGKGFLVRLVEFIMFMVMVLLLRGLVFLLTGR